MSTGNALLIALVFPIAAGIMAGPGRHRSSSGNRRWAKLQEGERALVDDGTCPRGYGGIVARARIPLRTYAGAGEVFH